MIRHATLCALFLALCACDSESPTDSGGAGIYRHSGNEQRGAVGTLLPSELTVFVAGPATETYWFAGDIDEVRIWSVARTAAQIRLDMYHHVDAQGGLIGYWPFDDGGGLTAADLSGQGHDGELTNCQGSGYPTWVPGVFTEVDTTGGE